MSSFDERWEERFTQLYDFLSAHGRLPRQFCNEPAEQALGNWMKAQRQSLKVGRLTVGRIARLRALPVDGVLQSSTPEARNHEKLDKLEEFHRHHGRLPKTTAPAGSDEYKLASAMIHHLRPGLKAGTLSKEVASRAARIPGVAQLEYIPDQDEKLKDLQRFIQVQGYVPRKSFRSRDLSDEERRLAQWIVNMLNRPLTAATQETLERLREVRQLVAESPSYSEHTVKLKLDFLEQYLQEHGTLPAVIRQTGLQKNAATWIRSRKEKGDADSFGPEESVRIKRLCSQFNNRDEAWDVRLVELLEYIKVNGKLPTGFHDGSIYHWLRTQRGIYRAGTLNPQRESALRAISGVLPKRKPGRPRTTPSAQN